MSDQSLGSPPVPTSDPVPPSAAPDGKPGMILMRQEHQISTRVGEEDDCRPAVDSADAALTAALAVSAHLAAGTLTRQQVVALEELANGMSVTDAAEVAGVSRATLYRWLARDPVVRAAYNRWKAACDESARSRLKALQDLAVDVVTEELDKKRNGRIAAMLLDRMGFLAPAPAGARDSRRAKLEIDLETRQLNLELGRRSHQIARDQSCVGSDHRVEPNKP